jgi:hypothetical protein
LTRQAVISPSNAASVARQVTLVKHDLARITCWRPINGSLMALAFLKTLGTKVEKRKNEKDLCTTHKDE